MTKTEKGGKRGAGKVAFWARRESIKQMLDDKYTMTATFLAHKKELNIEYQQFRRYVKEYLSEPQEGKKKQAIVKPEAKQKGKTTTEILNSPVNKEDII